MKINVKVLAELSHFVIAEEDIPTIEQEMIALLSLVKRFPEDLEVTDLMANPDQIMDLRTDVIGESLTREQTLANAPQKQAGCIVVPQTV